MSVLPYVVEQTSTVQEKEVMIFIQGFFLTELCF